MQNRSLITTTKRWLAVWWTGLVYDWRGWRAGECSWWQALWGHRVTPWWRVPGFMPKGSGRNG